MRRTIYYYSTLSSFIIFNILWRSKIAHKKIASEQKTITMIKNDIEENNNRERITHVIYTYIIYNKTKYTHHKCFLQTIGNNW